MPRYRKMPVEIDAEPVRELVRYAATDWQKLPDWVRAAYDNGTILFLPQAIEVATLEGRMTAAADDMLIRGVEGEIYPCKPSIFAGTYEEV